MTSGLEHALHQAWLRTLPGHPQIGADLLRRWQEPHRRYHDLRHLAESLAALSGIGCTAPTARVAIWFHDAVCDLRPDDEDRSAALAHDALLSAGVDRALVAEVSRLVLVTAHHMPDPADPIACAVSDADLWILSAAPGRYAASIADLRLEHPHLGPEEWLQQRRAQLEARLATPIYHSSAALARLAERARANLSRELNGLGVSKTEYPVPYGLPQGS